MNKMIVGLVAAMSLGLTACGGSNYPSPDQIAQQPVEQTVQQGGSFISEHPVATAAVVGAAGYYMGKRSARRNQGYYYAPQRRVVRRTTYVTRSPAYAPAYRTVTRTVRYRR